MGGSVLPECPLKIKFSSFTGELLSTADSAEKHGLKGAKKFVEEAVPVGWLNWIEGADFAENSIAIYMRCGSEGSCFA